MKLSVSEKHLPVDGGIGKMRIVVIERRQVISLCGKTSESLLVDVDGQWLEAGTHRVQAKVELVATNEQWPGNVLLYHCLAMVLQVCYVTVAHKFNDKQLSN